MFNNISEERYNEIIDKTDKIYKKEVIKNNDITSPHFTLELRRRRASNAIRNYNNYFDSNDEKLLFQLNTLIHENGIFANMLMQRCNKLFNETDGVTISKIYGLYMKVLYNKEIWDQIIQSIASEYLLKPKTIICKTNEILTFPNIYYPTADYARSLSLK
ncbi:MAG: hypothetical protein WC343_03590 [Bacilli bacterium]|jgi:hypothetical protein